ncbi:probable serine/threonine-protein kinase PBL28 [Rutidosis leptorrhynchoides]|uniref:probable serine/threonine-protein kinase PBL28 n=1 Tax=Rutidosis leptorrhynchoides TaxID=125765 RepID=UPI003A9978D2
MSSSEVYPRNYLIPMEEIKSATNDLSDSNLIIKRPPRWMGTPRSLIYKGKLSGGWGHRVVSIKRRVINNKERKSELISEELAIATSFHHENIITFIGYCIEGDETIKVQEYAMNGSLLDYLKDEYKKRNLTWAQRLKIGIGAARGLKHLHDGRVFHKKFSSKSILLDENLEAKITGFSDSEFVPENQLTIGMDWLSLSCKLESSVYHMDRPTMDGIIKALEEVLEIQIQELRITPKNF